MARPTLTASMTAACLLLGPGHGWATERGPAQADPARAALDRALAAYEDARALLAVDATEGVREAAIRLRVAARRAAAAVPEARRARIEALRQSAALLQRRAESNERIEDIRWAFGEVSRALIDLLAAEPALARHRFVFRCPVTQTYDKWVQTTESISNPYMGSRLPGCGVPVP